MAKILSEKMYRISYAEYMKLVVNSSIETNDEMEFNQACIDFERSTISNVDSWDAVPFAGLSETTFYELVTVQA